TVHVAVFLHGRPREEIAGGGTASDERIVSRLAAHRRDRPEIHDPDAVLARRIEEHEADASQAAVPRLDGGGAGGGGDGGAPRVAARREHTRAGPSRQTILSCHDAAAPPRERLANLPVLGLMHGHVKVLGTL